MYVTVNGVCLFFDVLGAGLEVAGSGLREKPVLVCVPGGPGGDHQTLRPYFDRFADIAQVVYFDPRGGGRSEHGVETDWRLDQWGDDIAAFCDTLGLTKPIVLGVSGGSLMVQAFLARHPDRAGGAILVNACSRFDREGLVSAYARHGGVKAAEAARAMYEEPGPAAYTNFFAHCLPLYSHKRDLSSLQEGAGRVLMNRAASSRFFGTDGEAFRMDFRGRLGSVDCRVLVVLGENDPVTPPKWGIEVAEDLPPGRGELLVFEACSHLITTDQPARFEAEIRRFIEAR